MPQTSTSKTDLIKKQLAHMQRRITELEQERAAHAAQLEQVHAQLEQERAARAEQQAQRYVLQHYWNQLRLKCRLLRRMKLNYTAAVHYSRHCVLSRALVHWHASASYARRIDVSYACAVRIQLRQSFALWRSMAYKSLKKQNTGLGARIVAFQDLLDEYTLDCANVLQTPLLTQSSLNYSESCASNSFTGDTDDTGDTDVVCNDTLLDPNVPAKTSRHISLDEQGTIDEFLQGVTDPTDDTDDTRTRLHQTSNNWHVSSHMLYAVALCILLIVAVCISDFQEPNQLL